MPSPSKPAVPLPAETAARGWGPAESASFSHSSLPWLADHSSARVRLVPLSSLSGLGKRDRLSILGQIAAHLAFLRFARTPWGVFDASEWEVGKRRGGEVRLVRQRIATTAGGEMGASSFLAQAAALLDVAGVESLGGGWVKPDSVYAEIDREMRLGGAGGRVWYRRAAAGTLTEPGVAGLRRLELREPVRLNVTESSAFDAIEAHAAAAQTGVVYRIGGPETTPLGALSAFARIRRAVPFSSTREGEAAERIDEAIGKQFAIFLVSDLDRFDASSVRLLKLLTSARRDFAWIVKGETPPPLVAAGEFEASQGPSIFFVSPRLSPRDDLERIALRLPATEREVWIDSLVQSPQFDRFLDDSVLPAPPATEPRIEEPRRSYLAALAVAGDEIPLPAATSILEALGWSRPLADLVVEQQIAVDDEVVRFEDAGVRRALEASLPIESRTLVCRLAADALEQSDEWRAVLLRLESGEVEDAERSLRSLPIRDVRRRSSLIETLNRLPATVRSNPFLHELHVDHLIAAGRYRTARSIAASLPEEARRIALARVERRLGRYRAALANLDHESVRRPVADVLRAELHRLQGDPARALESLDRAARQADEALRQRIAFEQTLLAIDGSVPLPPEILEGLSSAPYLRARLATYVALRMARYADARAEAETALAESADIPERVDASLDLIFTLFLSGSWDEARRASLEALALVEETEGDRAAGGVLFTFAWLSADAGEWTRSIDMLERLRVFYAETGDARRLRETALISAHLAYCQGNLVEARAQAMSLDSDALSPEEREALFLLFDNLDAAQGHLTTLRSQGSSGCVELTDRHRLLRARLRLAPANQIRSPFLRMLATWEGQRLLGERFPPPPPDNGTEGILILHSIRALGHHVDMEDCREAAGLIASMLGISIDWQENHDRPAQRELEILQRVATLRFPFQPSDLAGANWMFATRNRLGDWRQNGSISPLEPEALDELLRGKGAPPPGEADGNVARRDWLLCGPEALVYLEGVESWSAGSRSSLAALFLMRNEHHNLKRLRDRDEMSIAEAPPPAEQEGVIASSPIMRELLARVARVAQREVPVCIEGESGVGKELIARAIHRESPRRSRPFVAWNCASIPEHLLESELFGHARGAFTGADRDKPGIIESADGGTLFLDEVGEMPLQAQAKLLRFLQEGELRRLGESATRHADVRVVAATNRRLEVEVDEGRFREDLYYRIRGIEVRVPPLRERSSDILLLASHFLSIENRKHRKNLRFSEEVEAAFLAHRWPGNIRELQQAVLSAHALAGSAASIELEHLSPQLQSSRPVRRPTGTLFEEVDRFRRSLVERSLADAGGNQSHAARLLGISRQSLAYQMRELGILLPRRK